jgi:hypothetical protein
MSEELAVVLGIAGVMLLSAIVAWLVFRAHKPNDALTAEIALLTPSHTRAEAVVAAGASVELRALAVQGAHKVWLECDAEPQRPMVRDSDGHVAPAAGTGSGDRDGAPGAQTASRSAMNAKAHR